MLFMRIIRVLLINNLNQSKYICKHKRTYIISDQIPFHKIVHDIENQSTLNRVLGLTAHNHWKTTPPHASAHAAIKLLSNHHVLLLNHCAALRTDWNSSLKDSCLRSIMDLVKLHQKELWICEIMLPATSILLLLRVHVVMQISFQLSYFKPQVCHS